MSLVASFLVIMSLNDAGGTSSVFSTVACMRTLLPAPRRLLVFTLVAATAEKATDVPVETANRRAVILVESFMVLEIERREGMGGVSNGTDNICQSSEVLKKEM